MSKVMETFQPSAVALQCGSDSLSGDRLGCFNLTIKGKRGFLERGRVVTYSGRPQDALLVKINCVSSEGASQCFAGVQGASLKVGYLCLMAQ